MRRFLVLACTLFACCPFVSALSPDEATRPVITPVPATVAGRPAQVLSLQDDWLCLPDPEDGFFREAPDARYTPMRSPATGLPRRNVSRRVGLRRDVRIPATFSGNRIILQFKNTTQAARLWINGRFVREYWGAFSTWDADITDFVTPDEEAAIALLLERSDGLGAHVRFTGTLDDAALFAVPPTHIQQMRLETFFDARYRDATLRLKVRLSQPGSGSLRLAMTDRSGKRLQVSPASVRIPAGMTEMSFDFAVKSPRKWDAEHPNLYDVRLTLSDSRGRESETLASTYGFRQVELRGKQLFVNGDEVKFRGLWGGEDVRQLRDLNINHTRQKWATEAFLDSCDVHGIYVLDEHAVDFAKFGAELDTTFAYQWVNLIAEKIERDFNHPCVVMWGLGNESFTGPNVLDSYKYAKAEDPARPTIFSWGYRLKEDEEIPYDIFSVHYAPVADPTVDFSDYMVAICNAPNSLYDRKGPLPEMPVLIDESNHVTIPMAELTRDPNVRNFWGEGLKYTWERIWNTPGSLGLDQFGMYRYMNESMPEIWAFRKAFSPFVISRQVYDTPEPGQPLTLEVENRFCHTNLDELEIRWRTARSEGVVKGPSVPPRGKGRLVIPYTRFQDGDILELAAIRSDGYQVDEYRLEIGTPPVAIPEPATVPPTLEDGYQFITIRGPEFTFLFNKFSGQIQSVEYKGETVLTGGPHLNLLRSGLAVVEYWPISIQSRMEGREAVIDIETCYAPIFVDMQLRVDGAGVITTRYKIKHVPNDPPVAFTLPWNEADLGGYSEVGIQFILPAATDRIQWERRSTWTVYPEDHIGRPRGTAWKAVSAEPASWKDLNYDLYWLSGYQDRRETTNNDFRSTKEYIRRADLLLEGKTVGVEVFSQECDAVRLEADARTGAVRLFINNLWNYPQLAVGNYIKPPVLIGDGYENLVRMRLVDLASAQKP